MAKIIPDGIYVTMVTPFTDDNKIDFKGVEKLLGWYADHQVDGIFALCQSSEIFFLSFEEKMELIRFILANLPDKKMTILASGHTADDVLTQQKEAEAIASTGIEAYVFIANRFAKEGEGDDVLLKNAAEVVKAVPGLPLGVYECPYPYKRLLSPQVMRDLLEIGDFQFLKDTTCDVALMDAKIKAMKGTNFKLFNANSATLLESLEIGANGFSGVMANFHPEFYQELYQLYKAGDRRAQVMQDLIGFFSVAECQVYPVNAKYYLGKLEGLGFGFHTRTRNPAVEFPRNRQLEIDQMWALTQMWKNQKIYD